MASKCEHIDRLHYSYGLCQSCYLAQYYQKRKQKQLAKEQAKDAKDNDPKDPPDGSEKGSKMRKVCD